MLLLLFCERRAIHSISRQIFEFYSQFFVLHRKLSGLVESRRGRFNSIGEVQCHRSTTSTRLLLRLCERCHQAEPTTGSKKKRQSRPCSVTKSNEMSCSRRQLRLRVIMSLKNSWKSRFNLSSTSIHHQTESTIATCEREQASGRRKSPPNATKRLSFDDDTVGWLQLP